MTKIGIYVGAMVAMLLLAAACDESQFHFPFVSKQDYDLSLQENQHLKDSLEDTHAIIEKQNRDLAFILSELSSISNRSARLRVNGDEAPLSSMQLVQEDLDALKGRLDRLEKEAARVRSLDKELAVSKTTIKMLRETIDMQQDEIERLRSELLASRETIKYQEDRIADQGDTIKNQLDRLSVQKKRLSETVEKQTDMLFDAGNELASIADEGNFRITGNRNRTSVRQYRQMIYKKSLEYYQMAALGGHRSANDSIMSVIDRLNQL